MGTRSSVSARRAACGFWARVGEVHSLPQLKHFYCGWINKIGFKFINQDSMIITIACKSQNWIFGTQ